MLDSILEQAKHHKNDSIYQRQGTNSDFVLETVKGL